MKYPFSSAQLLPIHVGFNCILLMNLQITIIEPLLLDPKDQGGCSSASTSRTVDLSFFTFYGGPCQPIWDVRLDRIGLVSVFDPPSCLQSFDLVFSICHQVSKQTGILLLSLPLDILIWSLAGQTQTRVSLDFSDGSHNSVKRLETEWIDTAVSYLVAQWYVSELPTPVDHCWDASVYKDHFFLSWDTLEQVILHLVWLLLHCLLVDYSN
jgi:hypothetical protein